MSEREDIENLRHILLNATTSIQAELRMLRQSLLAIEAIVAEMTGAVKQYEKDVREYKNVPSSRNNKA